MRLTKLDETPLFIKKELKRKMDSYLKKNNFFSKDNTYGYTEILRKAFQWFKEKHNLENVVTLRSAMQDKQLEEHFETVSYEITKKTEKQLHQYGTKSGLMFIVLNDYFDWLDSHPETQVFYDIKKEQTREEEPTQYNISRREEKPVISSFNSNNELYDENGMLKAKTLDKKLKHKRKPQSTDGKSEWHENRKRGLENKLEIHKVLSEYEVGEELTTRDLKPLPYQHYIWELKSDDYIEIIPNGKGENGRMLPATIKIKNKIPEPIA